MNEQPNNPAQHEANKATRLALPDNVFQVPSVGRQIFYFAFGSAGGEFPPGVPRAAIVTEVDDPGNPFSSIGVAVLNPTGLFFDRHIPFGPGRSGHWGWPIYQAPVTVVLDKEADDE